MVPEPKTVTFQYEMQAKNGEELPAGLEYPDQILYLQLRMLYAQLQKGFIDRFTAIREKKKLLDEYQHYCYREQMGAEWVEVIRLTELARAEYRKNPCHENAIKLIEIIEGRKSHEQITL